jgi:hypothetical protein
VIVMATQPGLDLLYNMTVLLGIINHFEIDLLSLRR